VYGSLFFAGARTLADTLPSPVGASRPVVVLRLRGRTRAGSTLIDVLDEYADKLREVGGRLYLSGVQPALAEQLRDAGKLDIEREVWITPAQEIVGSSTRDAIAQANAWLGHLG
jgi:SulP family sulfate permease